MLASTKLDQDDVFDILSSPRRRNAISILHERDEPIELTDLAEEIAALESDTPVEEITAQQRKRVYVSLYQTHIPKLADADIVEYDPDTGLIEPGDGISIVNAFLAGPSDGIGWHKLYLLLSLGGGVLLVLTIFDVSVFSMLVTSTVAIFVVVAFGLLVFAQYASKTVFDDSPSELRR
ncbi:MAG: hypothetical protein ACI8XM_000836 [Haloarculaceae archaeon]|jgi:hypothetical protein